ncbi:hypothetical protein HPB49_013613 [Dermacentor silvarum]|uniref:Uncharacterized protein n=1 Tax=Dermacentor silvarum TaxID=543639 RepID=A0ACB8DPK6_DERSI|nr:hypothetical protein HPB49_013613 [Dermacentor silvarum]
MVPSKSTRHHDKVVLESENKPATSEGDVSPSHDQATHGDVVLPGKSLEITEELASRGASMNSSARCAEKKIAGDNDDNRRAIEPWQPFKLRYPRNPYPCPITYVLRGFESPFLDMRRISFVEPLPTTRVCVICWALPAMIMPLPCCHAVCFVCRYDAYADHPQRHDKDHKALTMFRSGVCPKDGVPFGDPHLEVVTCLKGVYSSLVFCVNGVLGCRSKVELGHLEAHCFNECLFNPTTCRRCGSSDIPACKIEHHSLLCAGPSTGSSDRRRAQRRRLQLLGVFSAAANASAAALRVLASSRQ